MAIVVVGDDQRLLLRKEKRYDLSARRRPANGDNGFKVAHYQLPSTAHSAPILSDIGSAIAALTVN